MFYLRLTKILVTGFLYAGLMEQRTRKCTATAFWRYAALHLEIGFLNIKVFDECVQGALWNKTPLKVVTDKRNLQNLKFLFR